MSNGVFRINGYNSVRRINSKLPSGSAVIPWWLSGGIAAANCVAAYQPKGAASYAASKVNLANPGTHDAADGAAYPTWDGTNGWMATAGSSQYLTTDITMGLSATNQSAIIRFSNSGSGNQYLFGHYSANKSYGLSPNFWGGAMIVQVYQQTNLGSGTGKTSGITCIAGSDIYHDGSDIGNLNVGTTQTSGAIYICAYFNGTAAAAFSTAYIQALAFYNIALTSTQVGLVTTAMAAL